MVALPNITRWKMLRPSPAFFLRLNLCTSLRIAMCSQKPGWFSSLMKVSLLLETSFYRAESSIPKMFILHADDTSTQKLEWWNKAWKIGFHWEQNICKVRLGLQIHFCQTLCSSIWIPCNSKQYHLTKMWNCYPLEIMLVTKWIPMCMYAKKEGDNDNDNSYSYEEEAKHHDDKSYISLPAGGSISGQ